MKKLLFFVGFALSITINAQVPSYVPTNGLVGYWPFTGNANDLSGNANNGTVNGATLTTDRFGNTNSAYSYNGLNNYINVNSSTTLNTANMNKLSICGWFNNVGVGSGNGTGFVVRLGNQNITNGGIGYEVYTYSGSLFVNNWWLNQTPHYGDSNPIQNNQWYFFVVVYDFDNNTASFYVNGVLINSKASTLYKSTNPILNIGRNTNIGSYFNGKIDDIGIWNRALTQQEVTNLYNANQCFNNITVTDTLVINVGQLSYTNPVTYANNITISPNPASTEININFNNITNLNGGTLKVINSLGQQVATTQITTSGTNSTMQLATWGGTGLYFVQIINPQGQIVDIKKIILQ
jgi:hypothetical protein